MPAIRTLRGFPRVFLALEPERRNRNYHASRGAGGLAVGVERRGEWRERLFVPGLGYRRTAQVEARRTGDDPVEAVREALRRDHPLPAAACSHERRAGLHGLRSGPDARRHRGGEEVVDAHGACANLGVRR